MSSLPAFPKPGQVRRVPKYLDDDGVYRFPDGREICDQKSKKGRDEYQRRKGTMHKRQKGVCNLQITAICKQRHGRWPVNEMQFDHEDGRGGGKQDDRIEVNGKPQNAVVCPFCNCEKGSRRIAYIDTP